MQNGSDSALRLVIVDDSVEDAEAIVSAMRNAGIEFRMITGGSFPKHEAIRFFDYEIVGGIANATLAHEHGFFVGNHPHDLTRELTQLRAVLNSW